MATFTSYLRRHSSAANLAGIAKGKPLRIFVSSQHTEVLSPGAAAFIGFADQARPVRFENAGASVLHTLSFGFNTGDATGAQEIGA